ncbi:hypothetical protein J1N35_021129 [Gossypium stocksii]|uniref:Reverse transcriptase zinc-binding domain-containing protein n=1 Tax=Gossypium stocksii TaxID=47602 RepID=A0A9D4A113_9ROSI|nr:hypothetical protein J1N35_021129 [Gossypium stocksii]
MYQYGSDDNSNVEKLFWKAKVPQRVRVFIWLMWKNKLLTNEERVRRHMTRSYSPPSMAMFHSGSMATDSEWSTSKSGWVKLNTDGAVSLSSNSATIGGVIRDPNDCIAKHVAIRFTNIQVFFEPSQIMRKLIKKDIMGFEF